VSGDVRLALDRRRAHRLLRPGFYSFPVRATFGVAAVRDAPVLALGDFAAATHLDPRLLNYR